MHAHMNLGLFRGYSTFNLVHASFCGPSKLYCNTASLRQCVTSFPQHCEIRHYMSWRDVLRIQHSWCSRRQLQICTHVHVCVCTAQVMPPTTEEYPPLYSRVEENNRCRSWTHCIHSTGSLTHALMCHTSNFPMITAGTCCAVKLNW